MEDDELRAVFAASVFGADGALDGAKNGQAAQGGQERAPARGVDQG